MVLSLSLKPSVVLYRYREVDESNQLIQWFWQVLESFDNDERIMFMRFVSGRSRLPANPADISQRFQIMKVDRVCPYTHHLGPFKGYVKLFFWRFETHPLPRNTNNVEPYIFVKLFSRKSDNHPTLLRYVTLEWPLSHNMIVIEDEIK